MCSLLSIPGRQNSKDMAMILMPCSCDITLVYILLWRVFANRSKVTNQQTLSREIIINYPGGLAGLVRFCVQKGKVSRSVGRDKGRKEQGANR